MGESSKSIEDLYAHLDLGPEDGLGMDLNEIPVEESNRRPQWCLVGKLLTKRSINFLAIKSIMMSVWSPVMEVWVQELKSNLFFVQFSHEMDFVRVINDGPWTFDQHLFVFQPLEEDTSPYDVVLNRVDFWVQVYDVPIGFMFERVAREIGNFIGQFVCSNPKNFDGRWREYIRIRVRVNVSKSLKRKMKIKKLNQEEVWINFKY
ncbi:hypothetical protein LguiA_010535 [Lonicera macranthoides]